MLLQVGIQRLLQHRQFDNGFFLAEKKFRLIIPFFPFPSPFRVSSSFCATWSTIREFVMRSSIGNYRPPFFFNFFVVLLRWWLSLYSFVPVGLRWWLSLYSFVPVGLFSHWYSLTEILRCICSSGDLCLVRQSGRLSWSCVYLFLCWPLCFSVGPVVAAVSRLTRSPPPRARDICAARWPTTTPLSTDWPTTGDVDQTKDVSYNFDRVMGWKRWIRGQILITWFLLQFRLNLGLSTNSTTSRSTSKTSTSGGTKHIRLVSDGLYDLVLIITFFLV